MPGALVLVSLLAALPVCEAETGRSALLGLHLAINVERVGAGLLPLSADPTLCDIAGERARSVAASGSPDLDLGRLNEIRRETFRRGYKPHSWAQTSLILNPGDRPLERWREVKPEAFQNSVHGDFEHVGIGVAVHEGRPVYSIVLGLTQRTEAWRRVEPLRDLEWARREMLARVNSIREENGRPPVAAHPQLELAAQRHGDDLLARDYYSHESLDGKDVRDRAVDAGFSRRVAISENLAKGIFTPTEVVDRWMDSSGHRQNILNPRFALLGNGIAFGENEEGVQVLWVQVFAAQ